MHDFNRTKIQAKLHRLKVRTKNLIAVLHLAPLEGIRTEA